MRGRNPPYPSSEFVMAKKINTEEKMVKVKILKHVAHFEPDQEVEVSEEMAKHLCHVNEIEDGLGGKVSYRRAMLLSEHKIEVAESKKIENLTVAEAEALGVVNTVESDPNFLKAFGEIPKHEEEKAE